MISDLIQKNRGDCSVLIFISTFIDMQCFQGSMACSFLHKFLWYSTFIELGCTCGSSQSVVS